MENHLNMSNQFVPYELAVKLKDLGFDYICLTKWGCSSYRLYDDYKICSNKDDIVISGDFVSAPLWQQAFDWFSEEHKINNFTHRCIDGQWCFEFFRDDFSDCWELYFCTKEEARKACLERLIELVSK